jgi:hypothetical protein
MVMIDPSNQNIHLGIFICMFEDTLKLLCHNFSTKCGHIKEVPGSAQRLPALTKDCHDFPRPFRQMPEYYHNLGHYHFLYNSVFTNHSLPFNNG